MWSLEAKGGNVARVTLQHYCDEARELINSGAYDEAVAVCHHILKRYPKHIETYRIMGEACLEKGEREDATDIFKRLLSADPENFVAYAGLGVLSEAQGALEEAVGHMERAFELAPNNDGIRDALRRLYAKRDGTEPVRIKLNKAALARMYVKGSQYEQAIREFQELLESNPDRMDLRVSLADTLWRDGQHEQAAKMAREILQTSPECLKAILLLGIILMKKGQRRQAQAMLDQARSMDPENRLAQAFFGEQSPLPVQTVRIPRVQIKVKPEAVPAEMEPLESASAPSLAEAAEPVPTEETELEPQQPTAAPSDEGTTAEGEVTASAEGVATETQAELAGSLSVEEDTAHEEETPAPTETIASSSLSDIERYKLELQRRPKDNETRLALARAYRDREQIKLALEQYGALARAKSQLLAEAIADMEGILASRPDNLDAHELLADLYVKNGQLQRAVDRLRWIEKRLAQRPS
jgi:tetratricopeptide (TPR) repeat protein